MIVVDDSVIVRVKARQDRRSTGRTQRGRYTSFSELDATFGELVQMGRFEKRVPHHAESIPAMIVAQDKDNVWALGRDRGNA